MVYPRIAAHPAITARVVANNQGRGGHDVGGTSSGAMQRADGGGLDKGQNHRQCDGWGAAIPSLRLGEPNAGEQPTEHETRNEHCGGQLEIELTRQEGR